MCVWVLDPLATTVNRLSPFPLIILPNANVKLRMCATITATTAMKLKSKWNEMA